MSERDDKPKLKPTYEKSWALAIGIDQYKPYQGKSLQALKTAVRGAKAVAGLLKERFGFTVSLLVNEQVTRESVMGELERMVKVAGPDDRFLFYYAGHGLTRKTRHGGEVGYLSLHDSRPGEWDTLLKMDDVLEQADFIPAKHILFVLDSCFSGLAFTRAEEFDSAEQWRLARDLLTHSAILAISAGRDGERAADVGPDGEHSLFTGRFLAGLKGDAPRSTGLLRAAQLSPWLQEQVRRQARAKQTPQFGHLPGSGLGDFIFEGWQAGGERPAETEEAPVAEPTRAAEDAFAAEAVEVVRPGRTIAQPGEPLPFEPEWVEIPAGQFMMGSAPTDYLAFDDERPYHPAQIHAPYLIARAPITNRLYAAFVNATGRPAPKHWRNTPALTEGADLPVVWVNWHDAMAYCEWLTAQLQSAGRLPAASWRVRLPSEAEWEKAARGEDGRRFPWGDDEPVSSQANFGNNEGALTPVGAYSPQGDSPYGCVDMAGNVWEWTQSLEKPYPYDARDGRESAEVRGRRTLRGGAYDSSARNVRCAGRNWNYPEARDETIGFRVVLANW